MANTATVTSLSTLKQRNLIDRAVELKTLIDGAKDELSEILDQFKVPRRQRLPRARWPQDPGSLLRAPVA